MNARVFLVFIAALLLAACSTYRGFRTDLAKEAVEDYNSVQEDVQVQLLARNILRAKDRLPRHFTGLGGGQVVQTTAGRFGPLGLTDDRTAVNLGTAAVPDFAAFELFKRSMSLGLDVTSTPRIDLAALDSKDFVTGMTSTVRYDVLHYFQRQGWPSHLMMLLFVRELQFGNERVRNDPGNHEGFAKFQKLTEAMARAKLELKARARSPNKDDMVGPPMCVSEVASLEHQSLAAQQQLRLFEVPDEADRCPEEKAWALARPNTDNYWSFDACDMVDSYAAQASGIDATIRSQIELAWIGARVDDSLPSGDAKVSAILKQWRTDLDVQEKSCGGTDCWMKTASSLQDVVPVHAPERYNRICAALREYQAVRQGRCSRFGDSETECGADPNINVASVNLNRVKATDQKLVVQGKALLRSPESIIYYLGQVVRAQEGGEPSVRYWTKHQGIEQSLILMSLGKIKDAGKALVHVSHRGDHYGVLDAPDDRTMTVMNAVLLLIGLQRSASELPTTPTVNVIGGG